MSMNARNNNTTRPRKSGTAKNRRQLEHRRRLMALGVAEDKVRRLDAAMVRTLLHDPRKIKIYVK